MPVAEVAIEAIIAVASLGDKFDQLAHRTVRIRNDDDHAIQFEFLQKGESRGKRWVPPGGTTEISFKPNVSTLWWCLAWFNGVHQPPMHFDVYKGHQRSVLYIIRKDDGIYKARLNGSKEQVFIKFGIG